MKRVSGTAVNVSSVLDFPTLVPLVVSVLGALGVATVIAQWFNSGKDRRAARAAVLMELADVESARWYRDGEIDDNRRLRDAIRKLETAALIARIPRRVLVPYAQLATAALWTTQYEVEKFEGDPEASSLPTPFFELLQEAASVVSWAAWSPPTARWLWLPVRLGRVNRMTNRIDNESVKARIARAREKVR